MVKDPVCGMLVDEKKAKFRTSYKGSSYFFCSLSCKSAFDKSPEKYLKDTSSQGCGCN